MLTTFLPPEALRLCANDTVHILPVASRHQIGTVMNAYKRLPRMHESLPPRLTVTICIKDDHVYLQCNRPTDASKIHTYIQ